MSSLAQEFQQTIERAAEQLQALPAASGQTVGVDGQWSAKQVLGHLIDSAANNHARFVRAQFKTDLVFDGYNQEEWIQAQNYEAEAWPALVELWCAYNRHLAHVIAGIPEEVLTRPRATHTLNKIAWQSVPADQPVTLEYLVRDYLGHLRAHLEQLLAAAQT